MSGRRLNGSLVIVFLFCLIALSPRAFAWGTITGQVKFNGSPVAGAMVGAKASPNATADAKAYTTTNSSGSFSFAANAFQNGAYYVAAWKYGLSPSADIQVTINNNTVTANPQITGFAGRNLATGDNKAIYVSTTGEQPAAYAVDGFLTTAWITVYDSSGVYADQQAIIDLDTLYGNTFDLNGVTIFWASGYEAKGYSVDVTTDDPQNPEAAWTTVYSTTSGNGGWYQWNWGSDPIRFDSPVQARAVRLHFTQYKSPNVQYGVWDIYIHSAAGANRITGRVMTEGGGALPDAVVGIKTSPNAAADATYYTRTDAAGNYGPIPVMPGTYYVAAWKEGLAPSADVQATVSSGQEIANPQITRLAGKNLSGGPSVSVTATSQAAGQPAANAVDGDPCTDWSTESGIPADQSATIDLDSATGNTFALSGVTIYWGGAPAGGYTIDVTTGDPATGPWSTVYSTSGTRGGYPPGGMGVDPVRFDSPVQARAVRLRLSQFTLGHSEYSVREIQIHSGASSNTISGRVTIVGSGMPGCVVGVKTSPNAAADAEYYATTDLSGSYNLANVPDGAYYVAAWRDGFAPSADTTVSVSGGSLATVDLQLNTLAGTNQALGANRTAYVSTETAGHPGNSARDGNVATSWASDPATGADQFAVIDLDTTGANTFNLGGLTIYWQTPPADYSVQVMSAGDPSNPFHWDDPVLWGAVVTDVYSAAGTSGGFAQGASGFVQGSVEAPPCRVDPIRFDAPVSARAVRIHCTRPVCDAGNYAIWEAQVHSATDYTSAVLGTVKDLSGIPIQDAFVGYPDYRDEAHHQFTRADGFYMFVMSPGTTQVQADAPGYKSMDALVTLASNGAPAVCNFALSPRPGNNLVRNGSFEEGDPLNPGVPRYWTTTLYNPSGSTVYGQYFVSLSKVYNHTTGGQTSGQFDTRQLTTASGQTAYVTLKWLTDFIHVQPMPNYAVHSPARYNFWVWRTAEGGRVAGGEATHYRLLGYERNDNPNAEPNLVAKSEPYDPFNNASPSGRWWAPRPQHRLEILPGSNYVRIELPTPVNLQTPSVVGTIDAVDDVVFEEVPVNAQGNAVNPEDNKVSSAKSFGDGTIVTLTGKSVTVAPRNGGVRTDYFYIEETDRYAGIRVKSPGDSFAPNDIVTVSGIAATTSAGERYIDATAAAVGSVSKTGGPQAIASLGQTTRAVQEDPLSEGLLVRTAGIVREVTRVGGVLTSFTITDGYTKDGAEVATKVVVPGDGDLLFFVDPDVRLTVTGAESAELDGSGKKVRVIVMRSLNVN